MAYESGPPLRPPGRRVVVQKFGGTSVGTPSRLSGVARIVGLAAEDRDVVCVVSAMSPGTKSEGTTSLLLGALAAAGAGESADGPLSVVEARHEAAISAAVTETVEAEAARAFLARQCADVRRVLDAVTVTRDVSPRVTDLVVSAGERLSAYLLSAVLRSGGVAAEYVDWSEVVSDADAASPRVFDALGRRVPRLLGGGGRVKVVTGFIGPVPGGLVGTVGRGYSDFTAALIAAGLGPGVVEVVEVWKEVDGVFSADPRKVPDARLIPELTPEEAAEITYFGAEVLHPLTAERISAASLPIRIRNTFRPDAPGTVIAPLRGERPARPLAVTGKRGVTVCTVRSNRMFEASGFLSAVFGVLRDHGVVVDLVSTSEVSVSFTVDAAAPLASALPQLRELGACDTLSGRAILAVVGGADRAGDGRAAAMFEALTGVPTDMITEAATRLNISCVVEEEGLDDAIRRVHRALFTGGPGGDAPG